MIILGPLGFLQPLFLTALFALPLLWWLLRLIPPKPKQVWFPPLRLLFALESQEQTSHHTPWWLLVLRMLVVALIILALANPVLNPKQFTEKTDAKALAILIDNGWASANDWDQRVNTLNAFLFQAEQSDQRVIVLPTANVDNVRNRQLRAKFHPAKLAKETSVDLVPRPFEPERMETLEVLSNLLNTRENKNLKTSIEIIWLSDTLDYGSAQQAMQKMAELVSGNANLRIVRKQANGVLALSSSSNATSGQLEAKVIRAQSGLPHQGYVHAFNSKGNRLGEAAFRFEPQQIVAKTTFDLPLELRNEITRLEVAGENSAGAVTLLDSQSRRQHIGLISGESVDDSQPLLSPLYYIKKALQPFSDLIIPNDININEAVDNVLQQKASVLMIADIGHLLGSTEKRLTTWINDGGILVRFAGPRLAQKGDGLLPAPLRQGGRILGGALSWDAPQTLSAFERESLFYGLKVTEEILISRQVLADPANTTLDNQVWARLSDGTPLVTAQKRGKGWVVLFHVTANPDWSNLPLSGVFVEMLKRIQELSQFTPLANKSTQSEQATSTEQENASVESLQLTQKELLNAAQVLNGFGQLVEPSSQVKPLSMEQLTITKPGPSHPPGYYGPLETTRVLNLITEKTVLRPNTYNTTNAIYLNYETPNAMKLQPWIMFAALSLFLIDALIIVIMSWGIGRAMTARAAILLGFTILVSAIFALPSTKIYAQNLTNETGKSNIKEENKAAYDFALSSTLKTKLAYVMTGNNEVDNISKFGLSGLSRVLAARTAIEPAEPVGLNIESDELVFFPFLYWPILPDAAALDDTTLAKIDSYVKNGGMILFDTRDYQNSAQVNMLGNAPSAIALQRVIGQLNIPQLEPVPEDHVLTKSFYLMRSFPGRWESGVLWVESRSKQKPGRQARRADGVSSILITSNDLAGAWALDNNNRPLLPTVPGGEFQREMAFRTGINIIMYALTGNYKADQVHVPDLLRRLGQ
ncbi:MAG: DUF4159 domain-containing protein [Pseudomonadota bacterium]